MIRWTHPHEYQCDACGAKGQGCIGQGHFGEPTTTMPSGWMVGIGPRIEDVDGYGEGDKILYACSHECADALDRRRS